MTPKIGLPYNLEFSNQKATFSYPKENILKAELKSKAFEGVELHIYIESNFEQEYEHIYDIYLTMKEEMSSV